MFNYELRKLYEIDPRQGQPLARPEKNLKFILDGNIDLVQPIKWCPVGWHFIDFILFLFTATMKPLMIP